MLCFPDMYILMSICDHDFGTQRCIVQYDWPQQTHRFRLERMVSGSYTWRQRDFNTLQELIEHAQEALDRWWWFYDSGRSASIFSQGNTILN